MLPGFEEITEELSDKEVKMAYNITRAFLHRGQENPITSTEIISKMTAKGFSITGPRLRKIIQYIRAKHMIKWLIAAGSNGYVWTKDEEKIKRYTDSLNKRESAMRNTRLSFPQY